ncbi:MAG TPA: TIGR03663 family protein, partial [Methanocorpusculum sp.]|nr:TIGR03663 family protein [Methanocorpusculum sp.]
ALAAVAAALGLCCKENMPLIIITFAVFLVYLLWTKKVILPKNWWKHAIAAVLIFFAIVFTMYTSFWQYPNMVIDAGQLAISHWLDMHNQQRLGGPAGYYFSIFVLYEMPILLLAIWGIIKFILPKKKEAQPDALSKTRPEAPSETRSEAQPDARSETLPETESGIPASVPETADSTAESAAPKKRCGEKLRAFFRRPEGPVQVNREHEFIRFAIFWMIISIITYAYLGEKVPWLSLHQLLPMILVAAFGLAVLKGKRQKVIAVITVIFLCIVTGATVFVPADINGPIVQVQNSEELRPLLEEMKNADRVAILSSQTTWPFMWYFCEDWGKNEKLTYFGTLIPQRSAEFGTYDVLIAHDTESYESLNGYDKRIQRLSYWFDAIETGGSGIGAVWNWLKFYFTRDGVSGSLNLAVYTRSTS